MKFIKPRTVNENANNFSIPNSIWDLNKIFNENNYKLYVVGGAVRDFITGDTPKDFDLCTDALPNDVLRILNGKYKVQLQGEAFAVVVVYTDDDSEGMEIATFREDVTKGRNPEVKIGNVTIEQDVMRRDLSINSLFYDLETKKIIDLVGGQDDLNNKIIRMVGDPMERIEEDPLRILRTFRFACRYGSKLDDKTTEAIHKNNDLSSISMERIWDSKNGEFLKSLKQSKDFQQYLDLLSEFNLWDQVLPGLSINPKITNSDNLTLVLSQILLNNTDENIKNILNKCSISTIVIGQIIFLKNILDFDSNNVYRLYKERKRLKIDDSMLSKWFSIKSIQHHDTIRFITYRPTITSQYVMKEFNIKPSPELGKKIEELEILKFGNNG